jgi:hypothetical protein
MFQALHTQAASQQLFCGVTHSTDGPSTPVVDHCLAAAMLTKLFPILQVPQCSSLPGLQELPTSETVNKQVRPHCAMVNI